MNLCENIRDLPWVVDKQLTFRARLFMKSGFVLSLFVLDGQDINRPFSSVNDDYLNTIVLSGSLNFGWESKLGHLGSMRSARTMLDDKKIAAWLAQYPDEVAKISHSLLYPTTYGQTDFYGAEKLNALPLVLNVLNELPLEKVCSIKYQAKVPVIFLKLLAEVTEDNHENEVNRSISIGHKLRLFFSPENRQEKIAQSILSRQFFERAETDLHVPYVLEKFLINYAGRNDDAVLMKAIYQNVSGPWDSWVNESVFIESMFNFERVKILAYFLHEGCLCESVIRNDIKQRGEDLLSTSTWNKINEQRMLLVSPAFDLPSKRLKI